MAAIFESLVSYIKSEMDNKTYSRDRAISYINAVARNTFVKGVIKVESKFVLFHLIDKDETEYIYWIAFGDNITIDHKAIHKAAHRNKKDETMIKHIMPIKQHQTNINKLRISELKDINAHLPVPTKRKDNLFKPNNPIERHAVPANVELTFTPIDADFLNTPDIGN